MGEQVIPINIKGISTYGLKFPLWYYRNLIEVIISLEPFFQLKPWAKTTALFWNSAMSFCNVLFHLSFNQLIFSQMKKYELEEMEPFNQWK